MMGATPFLLSVQAQRDIKAVIDHYLLAYGKITALRFHKVLAKSLRLLSQMPGMASPRRGTTLRIPGLRCWPLRRYPQLLYYLHLPGFSQLLRLMHERHHLPVFPFRV